MDTNSKFFGGPSELWDNRNSKLQGRPRPDFRNKRVAETTFIDGLYKPLSVQENLRGLRFKEGFRDAFSSNKIELSPNLSLHDRNALIHLIKSCEKHKDLYRARCIHTDILQKELIARDIYVSTALLSTYSKCGALGEAQKVFDELPVHDVVSWSSLISAYGQHGLDHEAVNCFRQMQYEGVFPNAVTFVSVLKACSCIGSLEIGEAIHIEVIKLGLLKENVVLDTGLVDMYAKCGELGKAQEVFDELPSRNLVTWSVLIAGYAQHSLNDEALSCFRQMLDEGISPNSVTYICALKACGSMGSVKIGEEMHAEVSKYGLLSENVVLGTTLVDMYAKCGDMQRALEVFDEMPVRNPVTWSALITGYAQHNLDNEALNCFRQMQDEGFFPNVVTFICILKACSNIGSHDIGENVHAQVSKQGLLKKNVVLGTALVDMYAKCGNLGKAQQVFDELPVRNLVTWSALITGYAQHTLDDEALYCFKQMQGEGIFPNVVTFICILKVCSSIGSVETGKDIHAEVSKQGLLKDILLGNALVDMYAKCGEMEKAQEVFDELLIRDTISWNALIAGYIQLSRDNEALNCFRHMQDEAIFPNAITFICVLKACSSIGSLEIGEEVHTEIDKLGLLEDIVLGNTLVDMYAKCGALGKAHKVCKELSVRDAISWNALITGYVQHDLGDEALSCFRQMRDDGIFPNVVTFIGVLKACGSIGSLQKGEETHAEVSKQELLNDVVLGNTLLDMYAKCGELGKAQEVFDELPVRDVVTWNALIAGYAQLGQAKRVSVLLKKMAGEERVPDLVTFLVVLTAYSHAGFIEEVGCTFDDMKAVYHLIPTLEHCTCLVDLLSRSGDFDQAIVLLENVLSFDRLPFLSGLLGACCKWVNIDVGKWAFEQSLQLDEKCAVAYVCMGNVYAAAGMYAEADKVEALRLKNEAWKVPGCWWTNASSNLSSLTVSDD